MSKDYDTTDTLEAWVMNKCDGWRDHFESNYSGRFDE